MNDQQPEVAQARASRDKSDYAILVIAAWLGFLGSLLLLVRLGRLQFSWHTLCQLAISLGSIATAAALVGRRRRPSMIGAVVVNLLWLGSIARVLSFMDRDTWPWLLFPASFFLPALFIWLPPLRRKLIGPQEGASNWSWLRRTALVGAGLFAFVLVASEGFRIQATFEEHQLQRTCDETGDIDACAGAARKRLRGAETIEQVVSATEQFRRVCDENKNGLACTWWAHTQSHFMLPATFHGKKVLVDHRKERIAQLCEKGNISACWAAQRIDEEAAAYLDPLGGSFITSCDEGDLLACDLVTRQPSPEGAARACELGWKRHCNAPQSDAKSLCWSGDPTSCGELADATTLPLEAAVYRAIAPTTPPAIDHTVWIEGYIGHVPKADSDALHEACDTGAPWACFGAGLQLVEGETKDWRPDLPSTEQLDATFGRACVLGMDASCLAYATRLLDVLVPDEASVRRANELADIACARGNYRACWLRDRGKAVLSGDYAPLRESARQTCLIAPTAKHPSCKTYANLLAHQLEASVSPMDDRVYFHLIRDICAKLGPPAACRRVAYMIQRDGGAEFALRRVAYDSAASACSQKDGHGCFNLSIMPRIFPAGAPATEADLRDSICEKTGLCELNR